VILPGIQTKQLVAEENAQRHTLLRFLVYCGKDVEK
jgi:hypothetical protein